MAETNGDRITVSRETLRAELTSLKLDLIQSLASKVEVDRLNERVGAIEMHGSPSLIGLKDEQHEQDKRLAEVETYLKTNKHLIREHEEMRDEVSALKVWRTRLAVLASAAVFLSPLATAYAIQHL